MHEKDAMQSLFQHFTFKLTFTFSFHHITRINLYKMYRYRLFTVGKVVLKVKLDILYLLSAKWVSSMFGKNN
jgi:hypothetical protein